MQYSEVVAEMKIIALVLVGLSICCELQAMPSGGCSRKYEDLLRQAVAVKKECGEAEVHDCCAVSIVIHEPSILSCNFTNTQVPVKIFK